MTYSASLPLGGARAPGAWVSCCLVLAAISACSSSSSSGGQSPEGGSGAAEGGIAGDAETADAEGADAEIPDGETGQAATADAEQGVDAGGSVRDGGPVANDGPSACGGAKLADGGSCTASPPANATIFGSAYSTTGFGVAFGGSPEQWDVVSFADPSESRPTVTPSASAIQISATLAAKAGGQTSAGVGISIDGTHCVDASGHSGISFMLTGSLGTCLLYVNAVTSQDESAIDDPCRGTCTGDCVSPTTQVTSLGTNSVPFFDFAGGKPNDAAETKQLIGIQFELKTPSAGAGCTANLTVSGLEFLTP